MTKQQLSGGEKRPGEQLRSFVGGGSGVLTYRLNVSVEQRCLMFVQLKANFLSLVGPLVRM